MSREKAIWKVRRGSAVFSPAMGPCLVPSGRLQSPIIMLTLERALSKDPYHGVE